MIVLQVFPNGGEPILQPVFRSRKLGDDLKVQEPKPPVINQQCVLYNFVCDLCDADYVGYTSRHLHQRIDEHRFSSFSLNLIYSISHLYFLYKLSFLFHSLLDNGAKMTPKRRSVFSLIFIVNSFDKPKLRFHSLTDAAPQFLQKLTPLSKC